jgi:hypothetical protein
LLPTAVPATAGLDSDFTKKNESKEKKKSKGEF